MARPEPVLIEALRATADRLADGASYRWTHMGNCNCGHLAQTVTRLDPGEIHRRAMMRPGDWTEQVRDHCGISGLPFDQVVASLLELGLNTNDLADLESLRNPRIRSRVRQDRGARPGTEISHRHRDDVVDYLRAWADLLEEQALDQATARGLWEPAGAPSGSKPVPA